jgi:heat shock protein HslJ
MPFVQRFAAARRGANLSMVVATFALVCAVGCATPRAEARQPSQAALAAIVNTTWAWTMLITTEDRPAIRIDEAGRYTLAMQPDGSLYGLADCQRFAGTVAVEGNAFSVKMSASYPADCPSSSYARQYLRLLSQVASYTTDARGLTLHLGSGGGTMVFLPVA